MITGSSVRCQTTRYEETNRNYTDGVNKTRTLDTFFPAVEYTYEAEGRDWTGTRIMLVDGGSSFDQARARVDRFPVGTKVTVYYNPHDASQAVLTPGHSFGSGSPIFLGVIVCLSTGAYLKIMVFSKFARQLVRALVGANDKECQEFHSVARLFAPPKVKTPNTEMHDGESSDAEPPESDTSDANRQDGSERSSGRRPDC